MNGDARTQSAPKITLQINILFTRKAANQTMSAPLWRIQWLHPKLKIRIQEGGGESKERYTQTCEKFLAPSWNFVSPSTSPSPYNLIHLSLLFPTTWSWAKFHRLKVQSSTFPSDTSHKLQGAHFSPEGYTFLDSHYTLGFDNWLEWLTELRKVRHSWLQFYYSKKIQIRTKQRKGSIVWGLGESQTWNLHRPQGLSPSQCINMWQPGKFT